MPTLAQIAAGTPVAVPPDPWAWRKCGCGETFFAPASRDRCLVCRLGPDVEVIRLGRGTAETDDEGVDAPVTDSEIRQRENAVREAIANGMAPAEFCVRNDVTAKALLWWCYNHKISWNGLPKPNTRVAEEFERQVDAMTEVVAGVEQVTAAPPVVLRFESDTSLAGSTAAATRLEIVASLATPPPPVPPTPPTPPAPPATSTSDAAPGDERDGAVVVRVKIAGTRIQLGRLEAEGDISDLEAELVIQHLRDLLKDRPGIEWVIAS